MLTHHQWLALPGKAEGMGPSFVSNQAKTAVLRLLNAQPERNPKSRNQLTNLVVELGFNSEVGSWIWNPYWKQRHSSQQSQGGRVMNQHTVACLTAIVNLLEKLPAERLLMDLWVTEPATCPFDQEAFDCGFAGCAIGWAIHAGLLPGVTFGNRYSSMIAGQPLLLEDGVHYWNWEAIELSLEIGRTDARWLFDPTKYWPDGWFALSDDVLKSYTTRDKVVSRIKQFIAEGRAMV